MSEIVEDADVIRTQEFDMGVGASREELDRIFASLKAPKVSSLNGAYKGTLLAVEGLRLLPLPVRFAMHWVLNVPFSPWKGKFFEKNRGGNMVLATDGSKQVGFFRVSRCAALDHSGAVIGLDYDVPENPVVMWAIKGELRALSEDRYLARMLYRTDSRVITVLYFTLETSYGV